MHEHKECNHKLHYCRQCDVVWCETCQQEWVRKGRQIYSPNPWGTNPWGTRTIVLKPATTLGNADGPVSGSVTQAAVPYTLTAGHRHARATHAES